MPGKMMMDKLNVPAHLRLMWWYNKYKFAVEDGINYTQHVAQTLIGRELKRMYYYASKCTQVFFNSYGN
jgi:hypothetical protein